MDNSDWEIKVDKHPSQLVIELNTNSSDVTAYFNLNNLLTMCNVDINEVTNVDVELMTKISSINHDPYSNAFLTITVDFERVS